MTYLNLTDKISETITKTKVFEKMEKIQFYFSSFVIISSIIGLTSIYINYCNLDKIKNLEDKIKSSENVLKYNIEISRKQYQIIYNKLIEQLKNELEISSKLIYEINKLQNSKPEVVSTTTSMSSFSPLKIILPEEKDDWNNYIIKQEIKEIQDNELLNECYDSIPMNDVKKNTALSWFFN